MAPLSCYLLCPAYPLADAERRHRAVSAATAFAARLGWRLVPSPLLDRHPGPGTWLPEAERLADLVEGLRHDVVWAARGGHGCLHLVRDLLAADVPRPPALIGFSDLTALHAVWARRAWGETLYGAMPGVPHGPRALEGLEALLRGGSCAWGSASLPGVRVLRPGRAEGPCFAACLSVLAALAGTPAMPPLGGCILGVEDIDERAYQVDRHLAQLSLAGALDGIRGLVAGTFPHRAPEGDRAPPVDEVLRTWAARLDVPAIAGFPFGHEPDPLPLAIGRATVVEAGDGAWSLTQLGR